MPGKFILKDDVRREELEIVRLGWLSHPASTGASKFTVLECTFFPRQGTQLPLPCRPRRTHLRGLRRG
jgi:hypothetical protein